MSMGAEQMVEIKGHYGIITKRVLKEWTGSEQGEWSWTNGNIVDAAAAGSELELEIIEGDYWIHIVGWNGDEDSSKSFTSVNDGGRYVADSTDNAFYYRFNGDLTDTSDGNTLTAVGDASTFPAENTPAEWPAAASVLQSSAGLAQGEMSPASQSGSSS
jgi:hypothetical protein